MPDQTLAVAAVQLCSGTDVEANLAAAESATRQAVAAGARLVVLPEYFPFMGMKDRDKLALQENPGDGPIQRRLAELAAQAGCWLVAGTIPVRAADPERPFGRCIVYRDDGSVAGSYDKIHLFDVDVADETRRYRESSACTPGADTLVVDTPWGGLGIAVCYDLRFPELFRRLVDRGALLLAVPAAFTARTGEAHWEMLLRARAVENQCFVIASAQGGHHENGRDTWGHSMVVDPWGRRLTQLGREPGLAEATLDFAELAQLRETFPALRHRVL